MEIRIGLAGYGSWGKRHYESWKGVHRARVVGIYDPKYTGKGSYRSLSQLCSDVDALDIVVPADKLAGVARAGIEAGRDILVEKPFAVNAAEAKALEEQLKRNDHPLVMVGFIERFNPVFRKLKFITEFLERPSSIFCQRSGTPTLIAQHTGVLKDLAIHDVDLLRWLLGEPTDVGVHSRREFHFGELELTFGQVSALLISDCLGPKIRRWVITYEDKTVYAQFHEDRWRLYTDGAEIKVSWRMPLQEELSYFAECVRNRQKPVPSIEDAVRALEIIEEA